MIHIETIAEYWSDDGILHVVEIARWYDGDAQAAYDLYKPFKAVATLVWRNSLVEICGLHGKMTRQMRKVLELALIERGAHKAFATRKGTVVEWSLKEPSHE